MIRNLKRKLYFLFVSSIMLVFTIVFLLLAHENLETIQNEELSFLNRQATMITLFSENSTNYIENLKLYEKKFDYAFRLFTSQNELLYESTNIEDLTQTINIFLKTLKRTEIATDDNGNNFISEQSGTITFHSENNKAYYGILCSIYTKTGYINLVILKEKSGIIDSLPAIAHFFLIWMTVFISVSLVSVLIIRQAVKPAEESIQSQKNFIAAVSHELKTPLAVILSTTDMIEASTDCTDNIKSHTSLIEMEISRMTKLIQDLLLLSSIDTGNWVFNKSEIDIDTLLINLYEKFMVICIQKSIDLQIKMPEECFPPLISDENRLSQIISIFLDNAISYSPEHSAILLEASIQKNNLTIRIIDHGIGICDEDKRHIFDRFYRCDKSRTKKGHYGLGLSIANELITLLDGTISLNDTSGGGCTFTITIPYPKYGTVQK